MGGLFILSSYYVGKAIKVSTDHCVFKCNVHDCLADGDGHIP